MMAPVETTPHVTVSGKTLAIQYYKTALRLIGIPEFLKSHPQLNFASTLS